MKKILTLSLALSALTFSASAQEERAINSDKNKMERHEGRRGERRDMMQDLNLSEAQKTQLKTNREEFKEKMTQLKSENLTEAQRSERRKALMLEQKSKMESILTPQQIQQLKANKGARGQKGSFEGKRKMHGNKQAMLKEKLALTDDQSAKLKSQHQVLKQKKMAIKNDASLSAEVKKAKMKDLKKEASEQRQSVLTTDQLAKMNELKKEHKNKNPKRAKK